MKRSNLLGLVLVTCLSAPMVAPGCATTDPALARDIDGLREEIRALRGEIAELKKATILTEPREIQLPKAATAEPAADLVISIPKDGKLLLGSQQVSREELKKKLMKLAAENPETRIVVHADETVKYQQMVEVLDLVRSAGIQKIGIATKQK